MKNGIIDVTDMLVAQMERMRDESLTPDEVAVEVARSKSISELGARYIEGARLVFDAHKFANEIGGVAKAQLPRILTKQADPIPPRLADVSHRRSA